MEVILEVSCIIHTFDACTNSYEYILSNEVPALEIDGNIVINDSYDIHKYLLENYPGKGNSSLTAEMKVVQEDFIAINLKWDEYLFSYRKIPKVMGAAMHQIRLVELSNAIRQAESGGLMDKKLMDGRTVRQVYIEKVAQIRSLIRIGCDNDNLEQLEVRIKANDERMEDILKSANRLLDSHKLLLTEDQMTSADVYLAVLIARISMVDGNLLKQKFADFPAIEKWWNRITALEVSECLKVGTSTKVKMLLGKSSKIFISALGLLNPHPLPEDMEKEVNNKLGEIMTAYYKP